MVTSVDVSNASEYQQYSIINSDISQIVYDALLDSYYGISKAGYIYNFGNKIISSSPTLITSPKEYFPSSGATLCEYFKYAGNWYALYDDGVSSYETPFSVLYFGNSLLNPVQYNVKINDRFFASHWYVNGYKFTFNINGSIYLVGREANYDSYWFQFNSNF